MSFLSKKLKSFFSFLKKCLFSLSDKRNLITLLLIIIIIFQFLQIRGLSFTSSFQKDKNSSFVQEIGNLNDVYSKFGNDINEIRQLLRLKTVNYNQLLEGKEPTKEEEDKNQDLVQMSLFKYISSVGEEENLNKTLYSKKLLLRNLAGSSYLKDLNLSISPAKETDEKFIFEIVDDNKNVICQYEIEKETGGLFLNSYTDSLKITTIKFADFEQEAAKFFKENKQKLSLKAYAISQKKNSISSVIKTEEIQKIVADKKIKIAESPKTSDTEFYYEIFNSSDELIAQIVLNLKNNNIYLKDFRLVGFDIIVSDIEKSLSPFLKKLDSRSLIERKSADSINSFKNTLLDKGFKLLLKQYGYKFSDVREDNSKLYYDLFDKYGNLTATFDIEKSTGSINVKTDQNSEAINLLFFDPNVSKKKALTLPTNLPDYGDTAISGPNSFNVLILGKQGMMVDTMIFAHIDEKNRNVKMVSIPRDLYYNGRKINSAYSLYGIDELKRIIAEISGYKVDKYILIDMYGFIDVINLIGGIDVKLEEPLVDPSYRVVENGVEGTLNYDIGDYHFNGVQALRVARSRKTSSDFSRARRQQMIIEAIQAKAKNFGFGDADTIYGIIKTVLAKTDTDISFDDAIVYFFRYQNYKVAGNEVLSSGNVLYTPPYVPIEECEKNDEQGLEPRPECLEQKNAYLLLPKEDKWDLVKWFFREQFAK
ncbi:MAG: LCP family protein [Candidatus Gracilibacteria bacterium]|jgi:LCP family protein required for cell wall assembly